MLDKVLIVANADESQEPAFEVITELRVSGYSSDLCRAPSENSKIKPDRLLHEATEISDYKAVIYMDDGGDEKSSLLIAKNANKAGVVVAGYGKGCMILAAAGCLKKKHVCMGLPKDAYKGAKMVKAPTVRSDNIVTCVGNCPGGFAVLLLDALGGEVKKVVKSWAERDRMNSDEAVNLSKNKARVAELLEPVCGPMAGSATGPVVQMKRTASGWAASGDAPRDHVEIAEAACLAFQSGLQDPDGATHVRVCLAQAAGGLGVARMDVPSHGGQASEHDTEREREIAVERELAHEGIWLQPDGRVAIQSYAGLNVLDRKQAMAELEAEYKQSLVGQLDVTTSDLDDNRRASQAAIRARHRLTLLSELLKWPWEKSKLKTASYGISGLGDPSGYGVRVDLKGDERVYPFKDVDEELADKDEQIRNQGRYNPEYDEDGFYARLTFPAGSVPTKTEFPQVSR